MPDDVLLVHVVAEALVVAGVVDLLLVGLYVDVVLDGVEELLSFLRRCAGRSLRGRSVGRGCSDCFRLVEGRGHERCSPSVEV